MKGGGVNSGTWGAAGDQPPCPICLVSQCGREGRRSATHPSGAADVMTSFQWRWKTGSGSAGASRAQCAYMANTPAHYLWFDLDSIDY